VIHRNVCVCDRERECEDGQDKDNISYTKTKTVNRVMQNGWLYDYMCNWHKLENGNQMAPNQEPLNYRVLNYLQYLIEYREMDADGEDLARLGRIHDIWRCITGMQSQKTCLERYALEKKARSSKKNKKSRGCNASFTILNEVAPTPLFGVEHGGWREDW